MKTFQTHRVDRQSKTPIISDKDIDLFVREVLADYKPKLLEKPGEINWEHFLESYCEVNLCFYDIYNEDPERAILGATAFNNEEMKVFDRDKMRVVPKKLERVTVVIDNSVMDSPNEGYARFTGLHEGGHRLIHPSVYMKDENQISLFEFADEIAPSQVVCCRKENIESFGDAMPTRGYRTPEEWREHHADYFAAAIAMPKDAFLPFVSDALCRYAGFDNRRIVLGNDYEDDEFARHRLPEMIRDALGVSKKAAFIKLKKCGFVIDERTYEQELRQRSMSPIYLA